MESAALNVPPLNTRQRIPIAAIEDVVGQIVARFQPEKIILFGSFAYGHPHPESDVDLLVVMDTQLSGRARQQKSLYQSAIALDWI